MLILQIHHIKSSRDETNFAIFYFQVTGSNVVYRNQLIYAPRAVQPFNFRQIQWTVDVECDVGRNGSASAHIHHGRNNSHPHVTGTGSYDVRMSFYSDSNFVHEISGNPLQVSVGTLVYTKVCSRYQVYINKRIH